MLVRYHLPCCDERNYITTVRKKGNKIFFGVAKLFLSRVPLFLGPEAKVGHLHTNLHLPLNFCGVPCGAPYGSKTYSYLLYDFFFFQSKVFTTRMVFSWHELRNALCVQQKRHAAIFEVAKHTVTYWSTALGWKSNLKHFGPRAP